MPELPDITVYVEALERSLAGAVLERVRAMPWTCVCAGSLDRAPEHARAVLAQVRRARLEPAGGSARVLPAHLESNFINPEYKGAQPEGCLRRPRLDPGELGADGEFSAADIKETIERAINGRNSINPILCHLRIA